MTDIPELEADNPWHQTPNTETIEMTSYALLCLTERGGISDAVPVTNWLFSQMNTNGGFAATSDTYAGKANILLSLNTTLEYSRFSITCPDRVR